MLQGPILLINFGGPRDLEEVRPFLISLLNDQELIRTSLPAFLHRLIFTPIAIKRSHKIREDYQCIGGKSPIYEDTETIAALLRDKLKRPVITYHRYLTTTHSAFLQEISKYQKEDILVFPFFPQFSYATTGSIATWFKHYLSRTLLHKMHWIKSYAAHPLYVCSCQKLIKEYLASKQLDEEKVFLLFSAHGLPEKFIQAGDIYQKECELSYLSIKKAFPKTKTLLAYQSQFGKDPWIRPHTKEVCEQIHSYVGTSKEVVIFPLSFTSDHIETLFEIETLYVREIHKNQLKAYRCPALNLREDWIDAICQMLMTESNFSNTQMLVRHF